MFKAPVVHSIVKPSRVGGRRPRMNQPKKWKCTRQSFHLLTPLPSNLPPRSAHPRGCIGFLRLHTPWHQSAGVRNWESALWRHGVSSGAHSWPVPNQLHAQTPFGSEAVSTTQCIPRLEGSVFVGESLLDWWSSYSNCSDREQSGCAGTCACLSAIVT